MIRKRKPNANRSAGWRLEGMQRMGIQPVIIGRGNAGRAMAKALGMIRVIDPELTFCDPIFLNRGESIRSLQNGMCDLLLMVANPHGLHCQTLVEADALGVQHVVLEKPACVSQDESTLLQSVQAEVAVCHVYRQMWGPQTLKAMIEQGDFGELIALEGRYWQSSAARRAVEPSSRSSGWKNDSKLGGNHDTLIDVAPHWVDLVQFLMGERAVRTQKWVSFKNSEAPHRDTHVQLHLEFSNQRYALGSISKTVHGSTNHFEIHVLGAKQTAEWKFELPDEIKIGRGSTKTILFRQSSQLGTQQLPFHGAGWLEGYVDIIHQVLRKMSGRSSQPYPNLKDHLSVMDCLLREKQLAID